MDDEFAKFYEECSEIENVGDRKEKQDSPQDKEVSQSYPKNSDIDTTEDTKAAEIKVTDNEASDEHVKIKKSEEKSSAVSDDNIEAKKCKDANVVTNENTKAVTDKGAVSDENIKIVDGERIYVSPETKEEFVWSDDMKQWVPRGYKPEFDGTTYRYTDKDGAVFKYNVDSSAWERDETPSSEHKYGFDGENYTYTDQKDNTVYFWDREKNAWFPKVDEDFMARYQMSYGFVDNTTKDEPQEDPNKKKDGKRKAPEPATWFDIDDDHNTKVYVSNLPLDITEQEFVDFMQKCGLVLKDAKTNKFKVKLYKEDNGTLKGDALCDYIKIESVQLALNVLDGADFKGKRVKIQRAKFQMKGEYNPQLKPKKKRKSEKEKEKKIKEKLLDWRPDKLRGEREKHERTVVIKNLFTPAMFDENVELILEYTEDIRSEAGKCGVVRKVTLYDKHPEGVATVTFSDAEEADICVKFFNNRWFGKRRIVCETWDGKTKYKVTESAAETKERLDKWNKFLEQEDRTKE